METVVHQTGDTTWQGYVYSDQTADSDGCLHGGDTLHETDELSSQDAAQAALAAWMSTR